MLNKMERILVLAPHTDDGEFGCGGTIAKLVEAGAELRYVAFSDCRDSLPEGWAPDALVTELMAATAVLGLPPDMVEVHGFPVRHFTRDRQLILEIMVALGKRFQPDLVLMPSLADVHQDHGVIAAEGVRAFKYTTILSYEIPWNNIRFNNQLFIHLEERHVQRKIEALSKYESQAGRPYANSETIMAQARLRGTQVSTKYAEVFEVVRGILL